MFLLVILLSAWWTPRCPGEETEADRVFTAAVRLFQGGWYDRSEKDLGAFVANFPASTNRLEAVLLQGQSRFQLKDYEGLISLLEPQLKDAGSWTDQYLYWLAQAQSELNRLEPAADTFARRPGRVGRRRR